MNSNEKKSGSKNDKSRDKGEEKLSRIRTSLMKI
jgi:hypothetical protein